MQSKFPLFVSIIFFISSQVVFAETPPEQAEAVKALRGFASNIQKNRDGTVRFVRFSKPIVSDEHLAHLSVFEQLDYLAVVSPNVSAEALKVVSRLKNLDTLFLSDSKANDSTLLQIGLLPKLERLYLDRTSLTGEGLKELVSLKSLRTLSLAGIALRDADLQAVGELKSLETLVLSDTEISDQALSHLSGLANLRSLVLDRTLIHGKHFNSLSQLEKLEVLSLRETSLLPTGLAALEKCSQLKQLSLVNTDLTANDCTDLMEMNSTLNIEFTPSEPLNAFQKFLQRQPLNGTATSPALDNSSLKMNGEFAEAGSISKWLPTNSDPPSFQRHVLPLLGRLGCNGRSCHGSFQGKGGFNLSMFGYDFSADHTAMTGGDVPRVNTENPDDSILLQKPLSDEHHGGGQRFTKNGWEHQLLRKWIAAGALGRPENPGTIVKFDVSPSVIEFKRAGETRQLKCIAHWSDGTNEDVTQFTRFQSNDDAIASVDEHGLIKSNSKGDTYIVSFYDSRVFSTHSLLPVSEFVGDRFPNVETSTEIDKLVTAKLSKLGIIPAERCSDEDFLRRVSLDLIGTLPIPDEIEAFLADESTDKRAKKIDELLESPAYAEWWAVRLADLTGSNAQYLGTTDMNTPAAIQWNQWLRQRLQVNLGWDEIAAGMILAESRRPGQSYEDYVAEQSAFLRKASPTDYTSRENPMHYYWFRSNNQQPVDRALSFSFAFLGVRLQCAQCHKHPFDQWSKQEFEQFTQFFTRIKAGISPAAKETQWQLKEKLGVPVKLDTAALRRQMYLRVAAEGLPIPWNEIYIEKPKETPQIAKLLGGTEFDLNEYADPREPLMQWLISEENPYFAAAFVNRIWHHYFGIGIVDPPDDFNQANPPTNKPLLAWLRREFIANGYDIKWLHKTITNSQTYQRSWVSNDTNRNDEHNFSRALIRRLPAEVAIDGIMQATASSSRLATWSSNPSGRKITQHPRSIQARGIDYSLLVFGKPLRTTNCDCERQQQPTLLQSLFVRNDHEMLGWLERKDGWLQEQAKLLGESLDIETTAGAAKVVKNQSTTLEASKHQELIKNAYLRVLSRYPTDQERERSQRHLSESENTIEGLRDLMWALLNTQEFLTNH